MWDSSAFLGALTPKFYVALTGTSSVISGLILIFEWWYFRKYGTSFIEQVSVTHLGPWLGNGNDESDINNSVSNNGNNECKVWRNPMSLLRGAEYARLWAVARRAPLTYYDMNLTAQEHQCWFGSSDSDPDSPAEEAMNAMWREREVSARVAAARRALALQPECASALLLLAEEDAPTVLEAERVLRRAWRAAEAAWRGAEGAAARRHHAVLSHVKRRAAVCARRLGRLRSAARLFRELARDAPLSTQENLIEVLLEQRAYADVAAVLARYEESSLPPTACTLYTRALLRARAAATAPGRSALELSAFEAIECAISFNPYVPEYLLELRALTLPPEHVVRRGDSEALAYSFHHLRHWMRADPSTPCHRDQTPLGLLHVSWRRMERAATRWRGEGGVGGGGSHESLAAADRSLLPPHHSPPTPPPLLPISLPLPLPPLPRALAVCTALAAFFALLLALTPLTARSDGATPFSSVAPLSAPLHRLLHLLHAI